MKKIIIIGNIGSGKTTISKILSKKMKVDHIELDEFRRKHNKKRTLEGEARARELFFRKISAKRMQIIELTGSGKVWNETISHIQDREKIIIHLDAPENILFKRMKDRVASKYYFPPLPNEWKMDFSMESLKTGIKWMKSNITGDADINIFTHANTPQEVALTILKYL